MSKIKFADGETPLLNEHQGYIFQPNHYGQSMYPAKRIARTRYPHQNEMQQFNQKAVAQWRNMSSETISDWVTFATTFPQPAKTNPALLLSGYQLFVKRNFYNFLQSGIDSPFILSPELIEVTNQTPIFTLTIVNGRLILNYSFANQLNDLTLSVYLSTGSHQSKFFGSGRQRFICFVGNQKTKSIKLGFLYNLPVALYSVDGEVLAPAGWRVPTYSDWLNLRAGTGGFDYGGTLKETGFVHWSEPNTGATNFYNFNARGAGVRTINGIFTAINQIADFIYTDGDNHNFELQYNSSGNWNGDTYTNKGCSIRLIKNDSVYVPSVTDFDGNIYSTCQIGSQIWTNENYSCTHYNAGTPIPNVTDNTAWSLLSTDAYCAYENNIDNVFYNVTGSVDVTDNYIKNFGILPLPNQWLTLSYLPFAMRSAQFFPKANIKIQVN